MSQPASEPATATPEAAREQAGALRLPLWVWLTAWMAVFVGGAVLVHRVAHGSVNGWQVALSFFLAVNLLICIWEISLWHRIRDIRRWFHMPSGQGDRPQTKGVRHDADIPERLGDFRDWVVAKSMEMDRYRINKEAEDSGNSQAS